MSKRTLAAFAALPALLAATPAYATTAPAWSQVDAAGNPSARTGSVMTYDGESAQVLLFGGDAGTVDMGDTWVYDGSRWHQLSPTTSPPAREWAAAAYDAADGTVVMFGGGPVTQPFGDTWTWDGADWHQMAPPASPPARTEASMAYDPATRRVVLFGGQTGTATELGDTWTWDGSTWTQALTAAGPAPRDSAAFADGSSLSPPVLFGGESAEPTRVELGDTWTWNGPADTWTAQPVTTSPGAREDTVMTRDPARGDVVLFGGRNHVSGELGDTWTWDGATWTQQSAAASPPAREFEGLAFDPHDQRVDLFGGDDIDLSSLAWLADTWGWDGAGWWPEDVAAPSDRLWAQAAPAGSGAAGAQPSGSVLFGGQDIYGDALGDTWRWDGGWRLLHPPSSPPARYGAGTAYDSVRGVTVLAGGLNPTLGFLGDTWLYSDAGGWHASQPLPTVAAFPSLAFDPDRGQTVIFGGCCVAHGQTLAVTATWDGSAWTARTPALSPLSRDGAAMAWDAAHHQVVLFGGRNETFDGTNTNSTILADTWTWDGSTWTEHQPATAPPAREFASMAYDPSTGAVVLFGGCPRADLTYGCLGPSFGDTWAWDGTSWSPLSPTVSPTARDGAAVTNAPALTVFGGESQGASKGVFGYGFLRDTWALNSAIQPAVPDGNGPLLVVAATAAGLTALGVTRLRRQIGTRASASRRRRQSSTSSL